VASFYPINGPCTSTTSLVIVTSGLVFMNCFVYDVFGQSPVVGPVVEFQVQGVTAMTIQSILLSDVVEVQDCVEVLRFNVITSVGTTSVDLPCTPSELEPYDLPSGGALVPAGERVQLRFTGMSNRHVFNLRRVYYKDVFPR
jgi:hypothetical protein